jgi:predicted RND superfamily exporter protein
VRWLYRYSIRRPAWVILMAVLITLAAAPGMLRLRLRTDGHALVPTDAPEVRIDETIRQRFGVRDPIVLLVRSNHQDGIFNTHTLKLVQDLTRTLGELEGVRPEDLFSLETEYSDRVKTGTLTPKRFLESLPETPKELETLRKDLREIELYTGTLVSYDGQSTAILVGVPADLDRIEFYEKIQDVIAGLGSVPETIHIIGAPVAEALLGTHILEDLGVPAMALGHRLGSPGAEAMYHASAWHLPKNWYEFKLLIARTVGLVPVAILVMALVFVVSFRSFTAAMLPLGEVGACLVFVFGLMGWTDVPIYLTIAVLPVILTAIGVADEIHIFSRYVQLHEAHPEDDHHAVVTDAMDEMCSPVVKTSITTAIGFLSFALSPIYPVRAFGVFMAVGIMFCMLWSLTVIPGMLTIFGPERFGAVRSKKRSGVKQDGMGFFANWGRTVARFRWLVLVIAVNVIIAAPFGVARIRIQDSWIDGFAPESEFFQATSLFNRQFLGTHLLLLEVDFGHETYTGEITAEDIDLHEIFVPGDLVDDPESLVGSSITLRVIPDDGTPPPRVQHHARMQWDSRVESAEREGDKIRIMAPQRAGSPKSWLRLRPGRKVTFTLTSHRARNPEYLERIAELERFIERHRALTVGGVHGPAKYVATTNFMTRARKEHERCIPTDPERVKWLWAQHRRIRGEDRHRQTVDDDYARCLTTVFLKDANFQSVGELMDEIRTFEREKLAPHGIKLRFGGDVSVSQTLIDAIVSTQVRSLLASLVGIFCVTALLTRSVLYGLLSVLPCALAVLVNFAVMGASSMPLGVATSMFAGMTLGIGVDYAIHLIERYRRCRGAGQTVDQSVSDAVAVAGPPILIDAIGVALGFGVLILSQVPANARLGRLVVLSIFGCFAATLLLLPAVLRILKPAARPNGTA